MKYISVWIFFCAFCGWTMINVECYSGMVPRDQTNDALYNHKLQRAATTKNIRYPSANKSTIRGQGPYRRLVGRHVCSQNKVTMVPMKEVQSYCKPAYHSYLRRCDKDNSRYCSGYRVVYEMAYRTVQRFVAKTESVPSCCPGWSSARINDPDCKKAICKEECKNGGSCAKPGHCTCPPGWTGKTCEIDVDECAGEKSPCDHECINGAGAFKCTCKNGYLLQSDGRKCKRKDVTRKETHVDDELSKKIDDLQQRLDILEKWQQRVLEDRKEERRHQRDDRINSLSEQIAILEERLEECSCAKRDELKFPEIPK